jgi:4-amino-4-deoxy-L-arabinose transferase-like glycosyltransferase
LLSTDSAPLPQANPDLPWWRAWEIPALILLVLAGYFIRAGDLPLRGEEPTRAQIAFEMVQSGDWIVPREQGEPFRIRPPFQNWTIAASCVVLGSWNEWAVRFPSVVATLLTTLVIYGYARVLMSRLGAFAGAAAFATMADIFKMGLYAETEALFIFQVSASLLVWHWGLLRRWPDSLTFGAGYGLMALGMLTKGIQAPAYFIGAIGAYLVLSGQWRRLFCRGHLVGLLAGAAVLLTWIIPYALLMGWPAVHAAWFGDPAVGNSSRIQNWQLGDVAMHLVTYPLEITAGMLPWSLMLLLYLRRDFRQTIGAARAQVFFLSVCLGVALPTCWIPPGGQPRFIAPLIPAFAVLIGLAIQRCAEALADSPLRAAWRRYLLVLMPIVVGTPLAIVTLAIFGAPHPLLEPWVEPPFAALAYAVAFGLLAVAMLYTRAAATVLQVRLGLGVLVVFLVIAFNGVVTDARVHRSVRVAEAVRQLKELLPPGQPLVSLGGHVDCLFPYYYGPPTITPRPWPTGNNRDAELTYFCFNCPGDSRPALPFAWEEIAAITMDRNQQAAPERVVVVGRRLPSADGPQRLHALPVGATGR